MVCVLFFTNVLAVKSLINIRRALIGNNIVDHSNVFGAPELVRLIL